MRCKFCFATFQDVKQELLPKGHLPKEDAVEVVKEFAALGFEKITFAGGEPTLCRWLPELIDTAKKVGMTTMIVTNGSKLSDDFLRNNQNNLDWIALSVDSLHPHTNLFAGRALVGKKPLQLSYYKALTEKIHSYGYGLKVNTVVSRSNFKEDMTEFMLHANPSRWKVLQVLPIEGQNDNDIGDFIISKHEFQKFLDTHKTLSNTINVVSEDNSQMQGSYAMVDPAGRFFDNTKGAHNYSRGILEVGAKQAIKEVNYDFEKFISRGGRYDWVR